MAHRPPKIGFNKILLPGPKGRIARMGSRKCVAPTSQLGSTPGFASVPSCCGTRPLVPSTANSSGKMGPKGAHFPGYFAVDCRDLGPKNWGSPIFSPPPHPKILGLRPNILSCFPAHFEVSSTMKMGLTAHFSWCLRPRN